MNLENITEIVNHLEKIKNIILYSSNIAPLDISLDFDEKSSKFKMDTELGENEFISCVKESKISHKEWRYISMCPFRKI